MQICNRFHTFFLFFTILVHKQHKRPSRKQLLNKKTDEHMKPRIYSLADVLQNRTKNGTVGFHLSTSVVSLIVQLLTKHELTAKQENPQAWVCLQLQLQKTHAQKKNKITSSPLCYLL